MWAHLISTQVMRICLQHLCGIWVSASRSNLTYMCGSTTQINLCYLHTGMMASCVRMPVPQTIPANNPSRAQTFVTPKVENKALYALNLNRHKNKQTNFKQP